MDSTRSYSHLPDITVYDDGKGNPQSVEAKVTVECDVKGTSARIPMRAWGPSEEKAIESLRDRLFELCSEITVRVQRALRAAAKKDPIEADYRHNPVGSD